MRLYGVKEKRVWVWILRGVGGREMKSYTIKKVLNNNVISVTDGERNYIFTGSGIGYNKKKNEIFEDTEAIEIQYISLEGLQNKDVDNFLEKIDVEVIEAVQKILIMVNEKTGKKYSMSDHAGLLDHIQFLVKRLQDKIEIHNPFLNETKLLYPQAYDVAERGVEILRNELLLEIPDDEVGFLTYHVHSGLKIVDKTRALRDVKLMNTIKNHIESKLGIDFEQHAFDYNRFIIHIKGVLKRLEEEKPLSNNLLTEIKSKYIIEYKIAFDVGLIIEQQLGLKVPDSEIGYIAIHLVKLNNG